MMMQHIRGDWKGQAQQSPQDQEEADRMLLCFENHREESEAQAPERGELPLPCDWSDQCIEQQSTYPDKEAVLRL